MLAVTAKDEIITQLCQEISWWRIENARRTRISLMLMSI